MEAREKTGVYEELERRHLMESGEEVLSELPLAKWSSFLEGGTLIANGEFPDTYSIFTYDVLYNLRLGTSLTLTECLARYLHSDIKYSHADGTENLRKPLRKMGDSYYASF